MKRHCLNLWSIGNQFIMSKCSVTTCSLLLNCKQKCMHLFCKTCNLFLYFLFKFGYQATHILHFILIGIHTMQGWTTSVSLSTETCFFFYIETFEVIFVQTYIAIDSPVRHSSKTPQDVLVRDIYLSYFFLSMFWRRDNGFCFVLTKMYTQLIVYKSIN